VESSRGQDERGSCSRETDCLPGCAAGFDRQVGGKDVNVVSWNLQDRVCLRKRGLRAPDALVHPRQPD
jgi:hypothetical protein